MGKIEDMRRAREQQFADNEARRTRAPKATPTTETVAPAPARAEATPAPTASPPKARHADAERGECAACGKTKPLENGVVASHQKGLGKACPGSRKPPV